MRFRKPNRRALEIESELRHCRPLADSTFVEALAQQTRAADHESIEIRPRPRPRRLRTARPIVAAVLTAAMFSTLAASGELGLAASGLEHATTSIAQLMHIVKRPRPATAPVQPSAANDQYRRPTSCRAKTEDKLDAKIIAARRAYRARVAAARKKLNAALRKCTTRRCRIAALQQEKRAVAAAALARRRQLSRAQREYLRLVRRCKN